MDLDLPPTKKKQGCRPVLPTPVMLSHDIQHPLSCLIMAFPSYNVFQSRKKPKGNQMEAKKKPKGNQQELSHKETKGQLKEAKGNQTETKGNQRCWLPTRLESDDPEAICFPPKRTLAAPANITDSIKITNKQNNMSKKVPQNIFSFVFKQAA